MAVVFISPKKKQKGFFMGITISLALFLSVISFWVFLAQPSVQEQKTTLNKPKVNVNLAILDSEQFKNLENFELMPLPVPSATGLANNGKGMFNFSKSDN